MLFKHQKNQSTWVNREYNIMMIVSKFVVNSIEWGQLFNECSVIEFSDDENNLTIKFPDTNDNLKELIDIYKDKSKLVISIDLYDFNPEPEIFRTYVLDLLPQKLTPSKLSNEEKFQSNIYCSFKILKMDITFNE